MPQKLEIAYSVLPDAAALASRAARQFVEIAERAVAARGRARIALSGGSTPRAAFAFLADPNQPWRVRMPWERLDLWWVDERCVGPDHPDSNFRMMREEVLDQVPLKAEQIHRMEGELEPEVAAARYEAELRRSFQLRAGELPRFDGVQLGMGTDGHTASLFPYTKALGETGRLVAANYVPQKDAWRITLTLPVINHAEEVFFLIGGADKARILKEVWMGPDDAERLPSQLISPSGCILALLVDRAAAAHLPETDEQGCGSIVRNR